MNFQTVAANNGNLVAMFATVAEIGNSKLNVNNKPIQSVRLTDDTGEQHNVTINKGKGELLDGSALGQRLGFNLSVFQGTTSQNQLYTGYSGFWNNRAQVNQGQSAPPKPRQAPSQATKSTNASKEVDWDAKDLRQARMNGLNNATRLICLLAEINKDATFCNADTIKTTAVEMVDYIYNGIKRQGGQPNPDYCGEGGAGEQPPEDDIPF